MTEKTERQEFEATDSLGWIQQESMKREAELRDTLLDLATNTAMAALQGQEGWKGLLAEMEAIRRKATEKLLTVRMDEYTLGQTQGYLRALNILLRKEQYSAEEIANRRKRASILSQQIQTDRQLLA